MTTPSQSERPDVFAKVAQDTHAPEGSIDPPLPVRGSVGRLLGWIVPANFGIFFVWGAVPSVLLAQQIALLDESRKVENLAIVTTLGALCAMLAQPVAGQVSDRTRSRFGRRAPWIIAGAVAGACALAGLALAGSVAVIAVAWCCVQIAFNLAQGPLAAVLPDRVPQRRRGTFAAMSGIGLMSGTLVGTIVGSVLLDQVALGYVIAGVVAVVALVVFVAANPDRPSTALEPAPFRLGDFLRTFWVNPVAHPDFGWAFLGRLLIYTGYFIVAGYQLYMLTDYIGVKDPHAQVALLALIGLGGLLISTSISGPLSDRVGRRKPFVAAAALTMSAGLVLPWISPTMSAVYAMAAVVGLGFGMFQAIDTALISEVLPSAESFGKDIGIVNIAGTLPQVIAPAAAGGVVLVAGYGALFPVAIVVAVCGALALWPIKAVR